MEEERVREAAHIESGNFHRGFFSSFTLLQTSQMVESRFAIGLIIPAMTAASVVQLQVQFNYRCSSTTRSQQVIVEAL